MRRSHLSKGKDFVLTLAYAFHDRQHVNQWQRTLRKQHLIPYVLTCTCVGIHPWQIKPTSPIELTTSRTEAPQARRSCASSLDTFIQSFLHRAWLTTRDPERGSRSALIVVAHVFSWRPVRLRHGLGGVGRMTKPAGPSLHE